MIRLNPKKRSKVNVTPGKSIEVKDLDDPETADPQEFKVNLSVAVTHMKRPKSGPKRRLSWIQQTHPQKTNPIIPSKKVMRSSDSPHLLRRSQILDSRRP